MARRASVRAVTIDRGSREFPYLQLAAILRGHIYSGRYPPGSRLPSIVHLEQEHGLSTMTVRRAMKVLASEGLADIVPGLGTFVARQVPRQPDDDEG